MGSAFSRLNCCSSCCHRDNPSSPPEQQQRDIELDEWAAPPALPPRRNIYMTGRDSEDDAAEAAAREQRAEERFHRSLYHETTIPFPWRDNDRGDGMVYLDHLESLDAAAVAAQEKRSRRRQRRAQMEERARLRWHRAEREERERRQQQQSVISELTAVLSRRREATSSDSQASVPMGAEASAWPMAGGAQTLPRVRKVRFDLQQLGAEEPLREHTTTRAEIHSPPSYAAALEYKRQRGGKW